MTDAQVEAVAEIIRKRGWYDNAEDCARAALAAAQAGAISIDARRRAEIADLCKANALLHAFMKDWDAEIARLHKANTLLLDTMAKQDAEIERLRAALEQIADPLLLEVRSSGMTASLQIIAKVQWIAREALGK